MSGNDLIPFPLKLFASGPPLEEARAAVILLHGRGSAAEEILALSQEFLFPKIAYLAPQAVARSWYPYSFLAPLSSNEPALSNSLQRISDLLRMCADCGIPPSRTVLLGFSQGACLALEFAARHPRKYAGVVGFSGALVGPRGTIRAYHGSLHQTPVFLGCSELDPHVPLDRIEETEQIFRQLEGEVIRRIYPAMGHTVNEDEIEFVRNLLSGLKADQKEQE